MMAIESIIHATEVLSKLSAISIHDLLPHRCALEHTLHIIKSTLESIQTESSRSCSAGPSSAVPSSPGSFSSDTPSTAPSVPRLETHAGGETERNDLSENSRDYIASDLKSFSQALSDCKQAKKIKKYLCSADPIKDLEGDWTQEDPRVVDIKVCSGTNSLDSKFRRGLAQRSLAIEFDYWEQEKYGSSRVSELHKNAAMADEKNGHIGEFIQLNADRFKDQKSILHGIKHGIRLRVFELTFGHPGVSAILVLFYSHFRGVKYKNHIELRSLILKSSWHSLAIQKSSWLEDCQHRYDIIRVAWRLGRDIWGATEGAPKPQWSPAQCQLNMSNGDEPIPLSEPRHVAMESQRSQERESSASMSRILTDGTQSLEPQVPGPIESTTAAIESQQIATHGQLAAPSVEDSSVDMPAAVQNASFCGPDLSYSGSIPSFNPLDYPNLPADSDSERTSQGISSTRFVFNPFDYPSLLPPLPGPGVVTPSVEFVFNPLNYPGIPSDPQNGELDSFLPSTTVPII